MYTDLQFQSIHIISLIERKYYLDCIFWARETIWFSFVYFSEKWNVFLDLGWHPQALAHLWPVRWARLEGRRRVQREVVVFPAPSLSLAAGPSPSRGHSACSPAKPNISHYNRALAVSGAFSSIMLSQCSVNTLTHIDTWMIGQYAVVGECDILLLPLFVERVPTALQQDALMEVTKPESENFIL